MNDEEELKRILTKLRERGYGRTELKEIVDEVCNNAKGRKFPEDIEVMEKAGEHD